MKLVDASDLKSEGPCGRGGSTPLSPTIQKKLDTYYFGQVDCVLGKHKPFVRALHGESPTSLPTINK